MSHKRLNDAMMLLHTEHWVGGREKILLLLLSSWNRLRSVVMVMVMEVRLIQEPSAVHKPRPSITQTNTEGTIKHTDAHNDNRYYEQSMQH